MSDAPDDANVKPKASYDPARKLERLIQAVRLPAGPDPRFLTGTVDAAHRKEFTAAVHRTWKDVQAEVIREIVTIESVLAQSDASRMPSDMSEWLRYLCRIWRRVNDGVAWTMIGQPETVKRLCANHVRPTLIDSNPASVAAILDDINKDPQSIAIWNDATTFLDVGDITARRSETPEELSFIELKTGNVNLAILRLQEALRVHRRAGDQQKTEQALDDFYSAYGSKGFRQLMRVTKQLMRDTRVMGDFSGEIARKAGRPREIEIDRVFTERLNESYDPGVEQLLRNAERDGAAFGSIDGCLWVYVILGRGITRQRAVEAFTNQVFASSPATKAWLLERTGKDILNPVVSMDQWFFVPTALPPFLRLMEASDIAAILLGRFKGRILLFFDWLRFEQTVRQTGCALTWLRPQPVDGKNVDEIVARRTPRIGHPNGQGLRLNKMFLSQILAEGMFPEAVAAQCARILEGM